MDTGGIIPDDTELIPTEIYYQAKVALEEPMPSCSSSTSVPSSPARTIDLIRLLQRGEKPVFLAVNKVEATPSPYPAENFRRLGIHNFFPISAEHGRASAICSTAICDALPAARPEARAYERDLRVRTPKKPPIRTDRR